MAVDQKVFTKTETETKSETANTDLITMSGPAIAQLSELISQQAEASPALGLRVFVYPGGCSGMSYGMAFEDQPAEARERTDVVGW